MDNAVLFIITEFCKLTGANQTQATDYLVRCNWDFDNALSTYYSDRDNLPSFDYDHFSDAPELPIPDVPGQLIPDAPGIPISDAHGAPAPDALMSPLLRSGRNGGRENFLRTSDSIGVIAEEPSGGEIAYEVVFWRNGFTVDDGPLRSYENPESAEFLDSIRDMQVPRELIPENGRRDIKVELKVRSSEDYVPPRMEAFSGVGRRLSEAAAAVVAEGMDIETVKEQVEMKIDHSLPITTLRVRLMNGSTMTISVNRCHTVGDIKKHIMSVNPEFANAPFTLMGSFPPKELDENATVEEANILNSTIVQNRRK